MICGVVLSGLIYMLKESRGNEVEKFMLRNIG